MPSQNLNSYYYPRYRAKLNYGQYFDLTLASDERDYDEEVVFSNDIIASSRGNTEGASVNRIYWAIKLLLGSIPP